MRRKFALAASTGLGEDGGSSADKFFFDLNETVYGSFSAKTTLTRDLAEIVDENAFE